MQHAPAYQYLPSTEVLHPFLLFCLKINLQTSTLSILILIASNMHTTLNPFPPSPCMYCCPSAPQPSKLVQNKILLPRCILFFLFQSCCCTSVCSAYILPPACCTSQHSSHLHAQLMILLHHFPMHFLTCLLLFHVDYIILSSHCP